MFTHCICVIRKNEKMKKKKSFVFVCSYFCLCFCYIKYCSITPLHTFNIIYIDWYKHMKLNDKNNFIYLFINLDSFNIVWWEKTSNTIQFSLIPSFSNFSAVVNSNTNIEFELILTTVCVCVWKEKKKVKKKKLKNNYYYGKNTHKRSQTTYPSL